MRVATVKGSLLIPPTYFAIQHAMLLRGRVESRVFAGAAQIDHNVDLDGLEIVDTSSSLPLVSGLDVRQRERISLLMPGRTAKAIREWHPEVVHQQVAYSSRAAISAAAEDVPLVVTVHGGDAFAPLRSSQGLSLPHRVALRRMQGEIAASFGAADRILAVSSYIAGIAVQAGAPESRVQVHLQGVDVDAFRPAPREEARSRLRVLFVGRIAETKGVLDLLDAASGLDVQLRFVGSGPMDAALRERASVDPRIVIKGSLERGSVIGEMQQADVLVLPTRVNNGAREAAGLVLLEAQAVGTPVIAYDSGGTSEMLAPEDSGFLVPEADVGALGERLRHFAALSDSAREALRARARAFVVESRSARAAADQLLDVYEGVQR